MINLKYSVSDFKKRKFNVVELEKIKGIKRIQTLYKQAMNKLHVSEQSLYNIEYFVFSKIAKSALSKYYKEKKLLTKAEQQAFLKTQTAKVVIVDALDDLGIKNRIHLYNIIQTIMLIELGIDLSNEEKEKEEVRKPSLSLQKLIDEARKRLEAAGLDRNDRYLIVRELDDIAFNKYVGDNYHNQLKRMGIDRTSDYLAFVDYVLN